MTGLGAQVPLFARGDGTGGTLAAWQRQDMLVPVLHGPGCRDCDRLRSALDSHAPLFAREQVQVVVVTFQDAELDPGGVHSTALAAAAIRPVGQALLVIADKFGRVYAALPVHGADAQTVMAEARDWIAFIQSQCEECGAPLDWV